MDYLNDNNPKGLRFALKVASHLPTFLTETEDLGELMGNTEAIKALPSSAFADSINREYPINTPTSTYLSTAYYHTQGKTASTSKEIGDVLVKAAKAHGILEDCEQLVKDIQNGIKSTTENYIKQASVNKKEVFALSFSEEDGASIKGNYLPITSAKDLIKSASELETCKHKIPALWVKRACIALTKRAKELGIDSSEIPNTILNNGVERVFSFENAMYHAEKRASTTGDTTYIDLVNAANAEPDTIELCIQGASKLDMLHGISQKYASKDFHHIGNFINPYDMFYSGDLLEAIEKDLDTYVKVATVLVPRTEFAKKSFKENVGIYFSKTASENILKDIDNLSGLDISMRVHELDDKSQKLILKSLL